MENLDLINYSVPLRCEEVCDFFF